MQHYKTTGPTLTNVTKMGRSAVKFGSIALVALIFGRMIFGAMVAYWQATHPEPPPPPTMGFGLLPALRFPIQDTADVPASYTLELPTGKFPEFPDRAKVFFMPKPELGLLSDQKGRKIAGLYRFESEPEPLNAQSYRWTMNQPLLATLELNIQTLTFTYTTDYLSRPELLLASDLPSNFDATQNTKAFLEIGDLLPDDVASSSGDISYKKSLGGELVEAVSVSDADFIQVDLNRFPIDGEYRMYSPEGKKGTIHAILTSTTTANDGVVHFESNYHEVDYTQVHTYPLRSANEAWKDVQEGKGFIVSNTNQEAVLRSVSLAYYDDFEYQQYLQPIYVFMGDGFMAYASALDQTKVVQEPN